ncbi:MAG: tRNA dihydrouridine(20/20a) synthase DusA [Gammaproteobacteria bacterium]|nr:tRNA dihydrouridine(20/20a) synthase DusA [Gammaproteobacteria bacterium]
MMDLTDRHCRYFLRLFSPRIKLYTEMITVNALIYGDQNRFLSYHPEEHPLAIQLGGSVPKDLAITAKMAEDRGFCEVNLNVGCPSDRVQKAKIGACLMAEPNLVAECVSAMREQVAIPVTVKTRIGIDEQDSYKFLHDFINTVSKAGCSSFIIHARKAWLSGLNPKQNREIPELDYQRVYTLKQDFNNLNIIINGGFKTCDQIKNSLQLVDGVMIGREAYYNPFLLAQINQEILGDKLLSRHEILESLYNYIIDELDNGTPWIKMARHYMGLFKDQPGARLWRQFLSECRGVSGQNFRVNINKILELMSKASYKQDIRQAG